MSLALLAALSLPAGASAQACPNAELREAQGATELPDCMAFELVTPPGKGGVAPWFPSISDDGQRVMYQFRGALADTGAYLNYIGGDFYVATRGARAWETASTMPPSDVDTDPGSGSQMFSPGFDRWVSLLASGGERFTGTMRVQSSGLGRAGEWLSPTLVPLDGLSNRDILLQAVATAASPDLSHYYFQPGGLPSGSQEARYIADDPTPARNFDRGARNTYVARFDLTGQPSIALLSRDASGVAWGGNCGAWVGGGNSNLSRYGATHGAVSTDGARTIVSARAAQPQSGACNLANKIRILEREEASLGVEISRLIPEDECDRLAGDPGGVCDPTDGNDLFESASSDGTKVYFTTSRQLADSDRDTGGDCGDTLATATGCDLYLFDSNKPDGQQLTQVSAGEANAAHPIAGAGARVPRNIAEVSGDGSRAYFVAAGVLTDAPNSEGATATDGQPNLYVFEAATGRTSFIGTLAADDTIFGVLNPAPDANQALAVPMLGQDGDGNEVGGDGHILVFASGAPLANGDADGGSTDIFRYDDESGELIRVTRAAAGGIDNEAIDTGDADYLTTSRGPDFADRGRRVSEDGNTIVFRSFARLVPGDDTDGALNAFVWRHDAAQGQLIQLPGAYISRYNNGVPKGQPGAPSVSRDGRQVAFETTAKLVAADTEAGVDIYVARADGGLPDSPQTPACDISAGECQGGGFDSVSRDTKTQFSSESGNAKSEARKTLAVSGLSKRARRKASRTGRVPVEVRASSAGRVSLTVKAKVGKKVRRVGHASKRVRAGQTTRVDLRLKRAARKLLHAGKKLWLTVEVRQSGARPRTRSILLPGVRS